MPEQAHEREAVEQFRKAAGVVFRSLRTERAWSFREFGERAGVAHTSLYNVERGEATPTVETLAAVARACGLTFGALLALVVDAMRPAPGDSSLAAVLAAAAPLSSEQRAEVLRFIGYLRFRDGDG